MLPAPPCGPEARVQPARETGCATVSRGDGNIVTLCLVTNHVYVVVRELVGTVLFLGLHSHVTHPNPY
jgi:hypothetical protein